MGTPHLGHEHVCRMRLVRRIYSLVFIQVSRPRWVPVVLMALIIWHNFCSTGYILSVRKLRCCNKGINIPSCKSSIVSMDVISKSRSIFFQLAHATLAVSFHNIFILDRLHNARSSQVTGLSPTILSMHADSTTRKQLVNILQR